MDDFAQQYLCEASTLEMPLDQRLAIYYHLQCEYFDRMVCSDRDAFGDAQPSSRMQRAEINRHAEWMIRQILHDYPDGRRTSPSHADQQVRQPVHDETTGGNVRTPLQPFRST